MKIRLTPRPPKRGFTLIELLVVIAIIVVLAAMGFGAGMMAIDKAKKAHALNDCTNLVMAVQAYYDDYSTLPDVAGADTAPGVKTKRPLMVILLGMEGTSGGGNSQNPKNTRFYQGREAKGSTESYAYGGVYYDTPELYDPWRKTSGTASQNRHYFMMLDTKGYGEGTSAEDTLTDPFGNKPLYGRLVVAWSSGKDGEYSEGSQSAQQNRDNVYSWK